MRESAADLWLGHAGHQALEEAHQVALGQGAVAPPVARVELALGAARVRLRV